MARPVATLSIEAQENMKEMKKFLLKIKVWE